MQRLASVIRLAADQVARYIELHERVWPGVLARITACHIRNYSIFLRQLDDGRHYLFSYFEYHGTDLRADLQLMAADPETQRWWRITDPMQEPLAGRAPGERWAGMQEVFHHDGADGIGQPPAAK